MLTLVVGVPQGSPVSPTLSVIDIAPILRELNDNLPRPVPGVQVWIKSYIDDFSLLAMSSSADENRTLPTVGLHQVVSLLQGVGMRIDPGEWELIHFSRRTAPSTPLITSAYGELLVISPAKECLRWLGISLTLNSAPTTTFGSCPTGQHQ
jgi:hypothetical protein